MRHAVARGDTAVQQKSSRHADSARRGHCPDGMSRTLVRIVPVFSEVNPMRSNRLLRLLLLLAVPGVLAACENPNDDDGGPRPGEDLVFLRPAANAPYLTTYDTSFVAVAGEDYDIRLRYDNGEECLRFRLDDDALTRRPNGTPMNEGDTITIRIRVVDSGYFNFEFQPAGLRFAEPAELRVNYQFAHPDFNGDGEVDEDDEDFEFGWWRQEMPGQDWEPIGSVRVHDLDEVRADIDGFTRYALAGGN